MCGITCIAWTKGRDHPIVHRLDMVWCLIRQLGVRARADSNRRSNVVYNILRRTLTCRAWRATPIDNEAADQIDRRRIMTRWTSYLATFLTATAPALAWAQGEPIRLVNLLELSGPIASAGTNYRNGVELAVKE